MFEDFYCEDDGGPDIEQNGDVEMPRQANRENGRRGANHTAPTLVEMRLAVAKNRLAVAQNKLKEQQRHHTASFEKHVASAVFGFYDSENHNILAISGKAVEQKK